MFLLVLFIFSFQFGDVAGDCSLTYYKGSEFQPNSARVHTGFLSEVENINRYAKECRVKVYITSSYRSSTDVSGAIVLPATRSNHLIGHAIDMNLVDEETGRFCNSGCLKSDDKPAGVTCFIGKIRADADLRWGGDFSTPDVVHIDDATNINHSALWDELFELIQNDCN